MYTKKEYLDSNPVVVKKLMETALSFAELSKCAAKQVCCLLYKDGNIISIGINGTPPDTVNCNEKFKKVNGVWYHNQNPQGIHPEWVECEDQEMHHRFSNFSEIHAEVNAISKALVPVEGAVAVLTLSPCFNCAKLFVAFGITKVYYHEEYEDFVDIKNFLNSQGIEMIRI